MNLTRLLAAAAAGATAVAASVALAGQAADASAPRAVDRAAPPILGANQVAMGDQVPWDRVGPGWRLAVIAQGPQGEYGVRTRVQLLDLVDPRGGRYQLLKSPVATDGSGYYRLADWSSDGRTALLQVDGAHGSRAVRLDLRTGARRTTPLDPRVLGVALGPRGGLFASRFGTRAGAPIVRIDADGTSHVLARHLTQTLLATPDSTRLVVAAQDRTDHHLRLLTSTGRLVRELAVPEGDCSPVRWWAPGVVLASCFGHGTSRLYAVPIDGSPRTAVSLDHGRRSADLGDLDARVLDATTYLEAGGPCGYVFLARQHADGTATQVHVPRSTGNVYLVGTRGSRLVLQHGVSCDGGRSRSAISLFDPATGEDRVIALLPLDEAYDSLLAYGEGRGLTP